MYQIAKQKFISALDKQMPIANPRLLQAQQPSEICWSHCAVGLGTLNPEFSVVSANEASFQLLQLSSGQVLGKNLLELAGFTAKAIEHITAILRARAHWKGMVRNDRLAIRLEINAIPDQQQSEPGEAGVRAYTVALVDYTDDYMQYQNLAAARTQAEKTDKAKSQFLSHMSHELRTPLNAILGFAQLMSLSPNLDEIEQDNLQEIESAGQFLLSLINEILDLSKIESGKLKLVEDSIALDMLFEECLALVGSMAKLRPVTLDMQLPDNLHIKTDQVRFKQVVLNLLSNAIKYNQPAGAVVLHASQTPHRTIRIEVQDSGRGIPKEKLEHIFSPFERLGADDRTIEGTGIGLMITRRLVKLMQGDIGVFSEVGRGSVFWLEFPLAPGLEAEPAADETSAFTHVPSERPIRISWLGESSPLYTLLESLKTLRPSMVLYQYHMPMPDQALFPLPDVLMCTPANVAEIVKLPRLYESLKHTVIVAVISQQDAVDFPPGFKPAGISLPHDCKLTTLLAMLDYNRHEQIQQ